MARYDDLNTRMIGYAAVLSIVVLILVLQGLQGLTARLVNTEDERKMRYEDYPLAAVKREQMATLDGYRRVEMPDESSEDPAATREIFQIPLPEAKQLILQELGN